MPIFRRRTFLGAAAVAVAGGAGVAAQFIRHPGSGAPGRGGTAHPATTAPPPRAPLLENALARENRLLTTLDHAAATTPALAPRIAVLRADHQAHAAALTALITAAGVTPKTTAAEITPKTTPSASVAATPARTADLVRWEKSAAAAVVTDFRTASGADAAVLASIYACEQTHVAWLS